MLDTVPSPTPPLCCCPSWVWTRFWLHLATVISPRGYCGLRRLNGYGCWTFALPLPLRRRWVLDAVLPLLPFAVCRAAAQLRFARAACQPPAFSPAAPIYICSLPPATALRAPACWFLAQPPPFTATPAAPSPAFLPTFTAFYYAAATRWRYLIPRTILHSLLLLWRSLLLYFASRCF